MRIARLGKFCLPYFYLLAVLSVLFLLFFCPSWLAQVQEKQGARSVPKLPRVLEWRTIEEMVPLFWQRLRQSAGKVRQRSGPNSSTARRITSEQNIYWNTDVYVQTVYGQQTKRVLDSRKGKTGLDRA
jgi:hypothetical protein